jgi:thymidylate kinase
MDRFELEALAFHEAVRQGYVWSMARAPERIVPISATGTAVEVFSRLIPHLDELLGKLGRAT